MTRYDFSIKPHNILLQNIICIIIIYARGILKYTFLLSTDGVACVFTITSRLSNIKRYNCAHHIYNNNMYVTNNDRWYYYYNNYKFIIGIVCKCTRGNKSRDHIRPDLYYAHAYRHITSIKWHVMYFTIISLYILLLN